MGTTVTVAPREIRDLAYMASRVAGCDAGTAERIADNVTVAEIHHTAAIGTFCDTLEAGGLPGSVWVTAPDAVLATELAARRGGSASATFESPVPLAAIAGTLQESLRRGVATAGIDDGARGDTTVGTIELRRVDDEAAAARRERIADARGGAHRLGIRVDGIGFSRLEDAAAAFLVAEATLDELS